MGSVRLVGSWALHPSPLLWTYFGACLCRIGWLVRSCSSGPTVLLLLQFALAFSGDLLLVGLTLRFLHWTFAVRRRRTSSRGSMLEVSASAVASVHSVVRLRCHGWWLHYHRALPLSVLLGVLLGLELVTVTGIVEALGPVTLVTGSGLTVGMLLERRSDTSADRLSCPAVTVSAAASACLPDPLRAFSPPSGPSRARRRRTSYRPLSTVTGLSRRRACWRKRLLRRRIRPATTRSSSCCANCGRRGTVRTALLQRDGGTLVPLSVGRLCQCQCLFAGAGVDPSCAWLFIGTRNYSAQERLPNVPVFTASFMTRVAGLKGGQDGDLDSGSLSGIVPHIVVAVPCSLQLPKTPIIPLSCFVDCMTLLIDILPEQSFGSKLSSSCLFLSRWTRSSRHCALVDYGTGTIAPVVLSLFSTRLCCVPCWNLSGHTCTTPVAVNVNNWNEL